MNFQQKQESKQDWNLSIIIPAYNEELRLGETLEDLFAYFNKGHSRFHLAELILVDDGSGDGTLELMTDFKRRSSLIRVIHFSQNQGKGAAVKAGLVSAQGHWILIADADQSTPWEEMEKLAQGAVESDSDLMMGSRALDPSQVLVHQAWWREGMGQFFNLFIRVLFGIHFRDTQCGFKLLRSPSSALLPLFQSLQIRRFAWDVELILRMQSSSLKISDISVTWRNKLNSRVHPIKDSLEMIFQLLKLKIQGFPNASQSLSHKRKE